MDLIENQKFDDAKPSDQAGTPEEIFEYFQQKFKIPKRWFYDPVIYALLWKRGVNFNALGEDWKSKLIYINHAWSQTEQFFP
jgi:hypothetical protein